MTMMRRTWLAAAAMILVAVGMSGCAGVGRLLRPAPHEAYDAMLREAGLDATGLGADWRRASVDALRTPVAVATPFQEVGYFPSNEATAVGYRLRLERGRQLSVEITFDTETPSRLFVDLFRVRPEEEPERVTFLDEGQSQLVHVVAQDGEYVLRLQPELLRGGRFTIVQRTLATLPFPVSGRTAAAVQSLFGAERDAGARAHEGIDVFAPAGTAAVAVTSGVARPDTNTLGGNVVWLSDRFGRRRFYYAHLERWAIDGMTAVEAGDVLGYVGTTGNARGGPPHLHFGIYDGGAINPLPFLRPDEARPAAASIDDARLGTSVRTTARQSMLQAGPRPERIGRTRLDQHTVARVLGVSAGWLRVSLPDRMTGYLRAGEVVAAERPIRSQRLAQAAALREQPFPLSPVVETLAGGTTAALLGRFGEYELMRGTEGRLAG